MEFLPAIANIIWDMPICLALALAMFISLRVCSFPDLTIDGSYALGMACSYVCVNHFDELGMTAFAVALALGALAGAATAGLYLLRPLPLYKLLAGLLVMFSLASITFRLMGQQETQGLRGADTVFNLLRRVDNELPYSVVRIIRPCTSVVAILAVLVMAYLVARVLAHPKGIILRAAGSRPAMIKVLGGSSQKMIVLGLMFANALVAFAGCLSAMMNNSAQYMAGGTILNALGALLMGEVVYDLLLTRYGDRTISPRYAIIACGVGAVVYTAARALADGVFSGLFGERFLAQDHKAAVSALLIVIIILSKIKKSETGVSAGDAAI